MIRSLGFFSKSARTTVSPPRPESKTPNAASELAKGLHLLDADESRRGAHERFVRHARERGTEPPFATAVGDDQHGHRFATILGAPFLNHVLDAHLVLAQGRSDDSQDAGTVSHVEPQVVARLE